LVDIARDLRQHERMKMVAPARNQKIHSYLKRRVASGPRVAESPWTVPGLCARYKLPTGLAGGGVIGIIELGGGWDASDMTAFFALIGQPVPNISDVSVDSTENLGAVAGGDASFEVALDIQVAAAVYYYMTGKPATIKVFWVQDMATGLRAAAAAGCSVFSMSWGADEAAWNTGTGAGSCADMQAAALAGLQAGMISFAASGDQGADDGTRKTSVDCPASCPAVIGCGGTTLTATTEVVWDDNSTNDATGGGYSGVFQPMSWQIGIPPAPSGLGRMVPDVASCADPNTGINIFCQGSATVVGGTSAAAPLWAGLAAACGVKLGKVNYRPVSNLYLSPAAFTDIVSGTNGAYNAGPGPDPCTGMGSPLGAAVATMLGTAGTDPPPPPPPPPPPGPSHTALDSALTVLGKSIGLIQNQNTRSTVEGDFRAASSELAAYETAVAAYIANSAQVGRNQPPRPQPPPRPPARPAPAPPRGNAPPGRGGRK
jgi:kumamolisin